MEGDGSGLKAQLGYTHLFEVSLDYMRLIPVLNDTIINKFLLQTFKTQLKQAVGMAHLVNYVFELHIKKIHIIT